MEIILCLENLSCEHCVKRVQKVLNAVSGVEQVVVELHEARVQGNASVESLISAVEKAGYGASLKH